jgi:transcription antitermination factor NusG
MTAVQIIEEIRHLPPEERERVVGFVRSIDRPRKLSSEELNELAQRLVDARTEEEAAKLKEQITAGFYGE